MPSIDTRQCSPDWAQPFLTVPVVGVRAAGRRCPRRGEPYALVHARSNRQVRVGIGPLLRGHPPRGSVGQFDSGVPPICLIFSATVYLLVQLAVTHLRAIFGVPQQEISHAGQGAGRRPPAGDVRNQRDPVLRAEHLVEQQALRSTFSSPICTKVDPLSASRSRHSTSRSSIPSR